MRFEELTKETQERIKENIQQEIITETPQFSRQNEDGTTTEEYNLSYYDDELDISFIYSITWTGINNWEDEGE